MASEQASMVEPSKPAWEVQFEHALFAIGEIPAIKLILLPGAVLLAISHMPNRSLFGNVTDCLDLVYPN